MSRPFEWSFRNHVEPMLAKLGCNSGACHGALAGKGGFRLSLRGYDPATDYFNIVKQDRGRRVELSDPGRSLVLAKPSGAIAHKGGIRFATNSLDYRILAEWMATAPRRPSDDDPRVEQLEILPVALDPARRPDPADPGPRPLLRRPHRRRHPLGEMVVGRRVGLPRRRTGQDLGHRAGRRRRRGLVCQPPRDRPDHRPL